MQFCVSMAQVAVVIGSRQTVPTAVHVESTLHVQLADPEGPMQVWCGPHAVPAFHAVQPLPCDGT